NKFRALVGEETSKALDAEGEFEKFQWKGNSMYTRAFAAKGTENALFSRLKAHEIRAKVDLAGVRRGVWAIPSVEINKFDFVLSDDRLPAEPPVDAADSGEADESSGGGGMFSGWIPSEIEVDEVKVNQVNFDVVLEGIRAKARGIGVSISPTSAAGSFAVAGKSGTLSADGYPDFAIDNFNLRTGEDRLYLDHAAMRFYRTAKVQLSGEASLGEPSRMLINGVLSGLELSEVLPPDWVKKFKGSIAGEFKLSTEAGGDGELITTGDLNLNNGSLEAMPVLQRIDTFAGTTRFRKLNFSSVDVEFENRAGLLVLEEVIFESAGLGCLKGRLKLEDGAPSGMYMLGISPDTIKWIPVGRKEVVEQVFSKNRESAFAEVFPRASADKIEMPPDGYRWLVVNIDPTSPDPYTADVRRQFIEAGGLAIWAELQGMPDRVVEAAGEVARAAGSQGVDLIGMLAEEGFGSQTLELTEGMVESLGESLKIDDLFNEGTAIPKTIINSGIDVINELNPLVPRKP
ncbi:MAG: hypothetical protein ACR2RV_14565, partial [Verrucomicrobiales bacterium]